MLSKSQAKWFFVTATGGFSGVFLLLTADTIRQLPERTHDDQITDEVRRGREIWDDNNCMGCHTLLGEGAYYAPELTKVVERRGETWIRMFLKDPQAMYPGRRKMVQYNFEEAEIDSLIAFFNWIQRIDTNGFPAKPRFNITGASAASTGSAASGSPEIFGAICTACHSVNGAGGAVGPALDGIGERMSAKDLDVWLKDPQAVKPGTAMPNLNLADSDRKALVNWLSTLK